MSSKPTREEKERRLAIVEQAISRAGWSLQLERSLAREFGVTTRTIRSYRREVVKGYRQELTEEEMETQRAEFVGRLRGHQRLALESGRLGPLASMMGLESRILGISREDVEATASSVEVVLRVPEYVDARLPE
tara:strand:- start:347 stop:748 length:402 start_codon:yes stop_codon:yes gene_type:complete